MYTSKHIFNLDYQRHAIWNAAFFAISLISPSSYDEWVVGQRRWVKPGFQFYTNDHLAASTCWMMDEKSTTFWALCCLSLTLSHSFSFSVGRYICVRHKLFLCAGVCVSTEQTHPDWHPACIILNTGSPHTFSKRLYNCFVCTKFVWITYW